MKLSLVSDPYESEGKLTDLDRVKDIYNALPSLNKPDSLLRPDLMNAFYQATKLSSKYTQEGQSLSNLGMLMGGASSTRRIASLINRAKIDDWQNEPGGGAGVDDWEL